MFAIYYSAERAITIGDILPFGQIKVVVLKIKGPFFWNVNGKSRYKLAVKKI